MSAGNVLIQGKSVEDRTKVVEVRTTPRGFLIVQPYPQLVALGKIEGWRIFRQFGMNPDVDSGTEDVWPPGTVRVLPTTAAVVSVTSDDATDDIGNTGALTVTINGLDANYAEISETIDMDGATPSLTTALFWRINSMFVASAGTNMTNAGNISATIGGDLNGFIEIDEGHSHMSQYTVPAGHALVLESISLTTGRVNTVDIQAQFQTRFNGGAWLTVLDVFPYEGQVKIDGAFTVMGETEMRVRCLTPSGTNLNMAAEYNGYLIDTNFI